MTPLKRDIMRLVCYFIGHDFEEGHWYFGIRSEFTGFRCRRCKHTEGAIH